MAVHWHTACNVNQPANFFRKLNKSPNQVKRSNMLSITATLAARRSANFSKDILDGLRAEHKYLPSKYFYDETGDKLFRQIMACPEYYPTRCEMEIMQHQSGKIAHIF